MSFNSANPNPRFRIGIDVGGTFTDLVFLDQENHVLLTHKVVSTPANPAAAILNGLKEILGEGWQSNHRIDSITHGSTVATNALLERKGSRTALLTTKGFKDVYKIGRQNRHDLYDLNIQSIPQLIEPTHAIEVDERVHASGEIQRPLSFDPNKIWQILHEANIESVAISLLFSFANPTHELELGNWLDRKGFFVSLSSDILPEFREYERTSTTLVNAYVSPILKSYLEKLEQEVGNKRLRVMQSNGGSIHAKEASRYGVRCILSGPAGGIAAAIASRNYGLLPEKRQGLITFDMGGTSTDVSLIKDQPSVIKDAVIGGYPVAIPVLDIHTIGAGGGSIAYLDSGGALKVGPRSAGADPGPACYGKSDLPTVTDANVVLGRILPEYFLGGGMQIYKDRAMAAIQALAEEAELNAIQCAQGIIDIANIHMAKALRVISVERGEDPADYLLVSFGGAGGLHAVDLAKHIGLTKVFIPATAAVFSAFGMLAADAVRDYSLTVMYSARVDIERIEKEFFSLEQKAIKDLEADGFSSSTIYLERQIDARYVGQSFEITIPYSPEYQTAFHSAHKIIYGYERHDGRVEIVNLRVRGIGKSDPAYFEITTEKEPGLENALLGMVEIYHNQLGKMPASAPELLHIPAYHGEMLPEGAIIQGPLLIVRNDTTIFAGQGDLVTVTKHGGLLIDVAGNI